MNLLCVVIHDPADEMWYRQIRRLQPGIHRKQLCVVSVINVEAEAVCVAFRDAVERRMESWGRHNAAEHIVGRLCQSPYRRHKIGIGLSEIPSLEVADEPQLISVPYTKVAKVLLQTTDLDCSRNIICVRCRVSHSLEEPLR